MELLIVVVVVAVILAGVMGYIRASSADSEFTVPLDVEVPVDEGEPLLLAEVAPAETIETAKVSTATTEATPAKPKRARKPRAKKTVEQ